MYLIEYYFWSILFLTLGIALKVPVTPIIWEKNVGNSEYANSATMSSTHRDFSRL